MESVLKNLDFIGILSIGLSGFGFLLIFMAFFLIYKEQSRSGDPRSGILSTIKFFMGINIANIVIVGILGLLTFQQNRTLKDTNKTLADAGEVNEAEIKLLNDGKKLDSLVIQNLNPQTPDVNTAVAAEAIESFTQSLDTLQAKSQNTKWDDSIRIAKEDLTRFAEAMKADKLNDTTTTKKAFEQILRQRDRVNNWVMKKREFAKNNTANQ
jgi:hypothetical protein